MKFAAVARHVRVRDSIVPRSHFENQGRFDAQHCDLTRAFRSSFIKKGLKYRVRVRGDRGVSHEFRLSVQDRVPKFQRALSDFLELPAVPTGTYFPGSASLLHRLDARLKIFFLALLLLLPPSGGSFENSGICLVLSFITMIVLPVRVWSSQLRAVIELCALISIFVVVGTDSVVPLIRTREPFAVFEGLLSVPRLEDAYTHACLYIGPLQITHKSVKIAVSSSFLTFTVLQSGYLLLCSTTPEALAVGIRWFLQPLRAFNAQIDELIFTLLLSIRFTAIVFEELRNTILGLAARYVDWYALDWRGLIGLISIFLLQILDSLCSTSTSMASAVMARGLRSVPQRWLLDPLGASFGNALRVHDKCILLLVVILAIFCH